MRAIQGTVRTTENCIGKAARDQNPRREVTGEVLNAHGFTAGKILVGATPLVTA